MARLGSLAGALVMTAALTSVPVAAAQEHGGGGGQGGGSQGGVGCGDVFGDLIHVKRDATTGVPILAMRWIELPQDIQGYGWGYCPIAVDAAGRELGFLPLSCDVDLMTGTPSEVNYFGRLSAGRTKERNQRMHLDEVILNIKASQIVQADEAGRLRMGTACQVNEGGKPVPSTCTWSVIDSPMENLALYHRLMKYGHIQTDPMEEDLWSHGDPAAGTQYHPALDAADWGKFQGHLKTALLPAQAADACFGGEGAFTAACATPAALTENDFVVAGAFLGGAAGKHNYITVDLVQYMNRVLKITKNTTAEPTGGTLPTLNTLPAQVRDCWPEGQPTPPPPAEDEIPVEPTYLPVEQCTVADATSALPNYDLFMEVKERFVDFAPVTYVRSQWFGDRSVSIVRPQDPTSLDPLVFLVEQAFPVMNWLDYANPAMSIGANIEGFVYGTSDALRAIEFIHNYEVPEILWTFTPAPVRR